MLGSFVSRYNDVDGYWGIGQLYRHAQAVGCGAVSIDLLGRTMYPAGERFQHIIDGYADMLVTQLAGQRIPIEWLLSARVAIAFGETSETPQLFETAADGDPFVCGVHLEDDTRNMRSVITSGRCRPHGVSRENRRLAQDRNLQRSALENRKQNDDG